MKFFSIKAKEPEGSVPPPVISSPPPPHALVVERYSLLKPFAYCVIIEEPVTSSYVYYIDELQMNKDEVEVYGKVLRTMEMELDISREGTSQRKFLREKMDEIITRYKMWKEKIDEISWAKIQYYSERDLLGFAAIDPLMRDPNIEDVSVTGTGKPVYIWHRRYESMATNLALPTDKQLDEIIAKLAHMAGKHISSAFPIIDATLPGRHRLSATYRKEVSPQGSTLTIRKFREDPLTIVDLLNLDVIDHKMVAYAWLLMENKATAIVVGSTAAGKTTLLNALLTMTPAHSKIVTIEEVQEINIPHINWAPLVSRLSYGVGSDSITEINLFDLVKTAMRMRPDILVVGEVRGNEAFVLFQAITTGHGGMCTLHAEDSKSAVQRLTTNPMNVSSNYIPFLDLIFVVRRVQLPFPSSFMQHARRIMAIEEITSTGGLNKLFEWDPATDTHKSKNLADSEKLKKLAQTQGTSMKNVLQEVQRRSNVLKWLQYKGIREYKELGAIFEQYRRNPEAIYSQVVEEIEVSGLS